MKLNRMRGAIRPAILALLLGSTAAAPVLAQSLIPALPIGKERILVAQNQQDTAQLLMRLQDLEEQVRNLTGRIEGLEFQLQQLLKQAQDNEFRFQELEGGAMGKPQAAAPTDGATPSATLPQAPDTDVPVTANTDQFPADAGVPMDDLGASADPLLSGGLDQLGTLTEDQLSLDPGRPLDLSLSGTGEISSGDAIAQYQAGYDAMTRGDYAFAEDQFTQFVALYPTDPQVPDAINYLGEALIQRGAYTDAAQVLADGYTQHRESTRAPDIMLKLGVALVGAEQADVGCRTFYTLAQRYPNLSPAFQQRLAEEQQKAQCPVAN